MGGLHHVEGQILGRAALHDVGSPKIALPVLAVAGAVEVAVLRRGRFGAVDVRAAHVAGGEAQAGDADADEVEVVARLPGTLVGVVEVGDLGGAVQLDVVGVPHVVERRVAVDAGVGKGEGVSADAEADAGAPRVVVDLAE
ncbi:hypothetical protein D3C78_1190580 [compost metagenome]